MWKNLTYIFWCLFLGFVPFYGVYGQSVADMDDDDDGIPDVVEVCGPGATDFSCFGGSDPADDDDNDGILNYMDWDWCWLNNAGVCKFIDTDSDGVPDFLDRDSDNDGTPDIIESGGTDINGDGRVDGYTDVNDLSTLIDPNGNGWSAIYDPGDGGIPLLDLDMDTDLYIDRLDLDADNDGIPDVTEQGGVDTDGDGYVDNYSDDDNDGFTDTYDPTNEVNMGGVTGYPLAMTGADSGDGTPTDVGTSADQDKNGIPNYLDLDADDDGIPDVTESGGVDTNGDGVADSYRDNDRDGYNDIYDGIVAPLTTGGNPLVLTDVGDGMGKPVSYMTGDHDMDGTLNYLDLDSDNDGITDVIESKGADSDGNGIVDTYIDADGDGYTDTYDASEGGDPLIQTGEDADVDGRPDRYPMGDQDRDDLLNELDIDDDSDGIVDLQEAFGGDLDGDGLVDNQLDIDLDGYHDGYNPKNGGTPLVVSGIDTNNDGYPDGPGTANTDTDALYNFLDIDSDNDGIIDIVEWQPTIGYLQPLDFDLDKDGLDDQYDRDFVPLPPRLNNVDSDMFPDFVDSDSDGDLIPDCIEGWDRDANGLDGSEPNPGHVIGLYPTGPDTDGDGLLDVYDTINYAVSIFTTPNVTNGYVLPTLYPYNSDGVPGIPGGADMDWREIPQDALPVEISSFGVVLDVVDADLSWKTSREENSSFFTVQRSIDGVSFENVGEVSAAGQSVVEQSYAFTDENVGRFNVTRLFYRLKAVDLDGSFAYSDMLELEIPTTILLGASVFPNPAKGLTHIAFRSAEESTGKGEIVITSITGKQMFKVAFEGGDRVALVDVSTFAAGTYIVSVLSEGGVKHLRMIVSE